MDSIVENGELHFFLANTLFEVIFFYRVCKIMFCMFVQYNILRVWM